MSIIIGILIIIIILLLFKLLIDQNIIPKSQFEHLFDNPSNEILNNINNKIILNPPILEKTDIWKNVENNRKSVAPNANKAEPIKSREFQPIGLEDNENYIYNHSERDKSGATISDRYVETRANDNASMNYVDKELSSNIYDTRFDTDTGNIYDITFAALDPVSPLGREFEFQGNILHMSQYH